jgi:quercetin dioxygenase-like cupin family protein
MNRLVPQNQTRRIETPNAVMTTLASPTLGGTTDLSLWTVEMSAGSSGPLHRFDSEQLWTVLDGELRVELEGEELRLITGDTIVLPAAAERQIHAETDTRTIVCGNADGVAWVSAEDAARGVPPWIA